MYTIIKWLKLITAFLYDQDIKLSYTTIQINTSSCHTANKLLAIGIPLSVRLEENEWAWASTHCHTVLDLDTHTPATNLTTANTHSTTVQKNKNNIITFWEVALLHILPDIQHRMVTNFLSIENRNDFTISELCT